MQSAFALKPTALINKAEPTPLTCKTYTSAYRYVNATFCKRYFGTLFIFSGLLAILFQSRFSFTYGK